MTDLEDGASQALTYAEAVQLVERYIGAYTRRDLDGMLAVMDENVVSYPAPLFGHRPHFGHAGVRGWWAAMLASNERYDVQVTEIRQIGSDRIAILGEVHGAAGKPLSPWAVLIRVRNGVIVESRSYLSDKELLAELGLLESEAPWR